MKKSMVLKMDNIKGPKRDADGGQEENHRVSSTEGTSTAVESEKQFRIPPGFVTG